MNREMGREEAAAVGFLVRGGTGGGRSAPSVKLLAGKVRKCQGFRSTEPRGGGSIEVMARASPRNSPEVDAYIARASDSVRKKLQAVRFAIRAAVPDATEVISYRMPGYS